MHSPISKKSPKALSGGGGVGSGEIPTGKKKKLARACQAITQECFFCSLNEHVTTIKTMYT